MLSRIYTFTFKYTRSPIKLERYISLIYSIASSPASIIFISDFRSNRTKIYIFFVLNAEKSMRVYLTSDGLFLPLPLRGGG